MKSRQSVSSGRAPEGPASGGPSVADPGSNAVALDSLGASGPASGVVPIFAVSGLSPAKDGGQLVSFQEGGVVIGGSSMVASASVQATGASAAEISQWRVGFVQNVLESERRGYYLDEKGAEVAIGVDGTISSATVDAAPDTIPWFEASASRQVRSDGIPAKISMRDTPGSETMPVHAAGGTLQRFAGKDRFTTKVVATNAETGQVEVLATFPWAEDFAAEVTPALQGGTPTSAGVTVGGVAQGGAVPVMSGATANQSVSKVAITPTKKT